MHNKYTLVKKTKEFLLDEINTFSKELIHFFNIDKLNACIFIYLEIEGKKIKTEKNKINYYKLALNDIKEEKKEIICEILENIQIKILIRIINKKEKIKQDKLLDIKENDIDKKREKIYTQYNGNINNNLDNNSAISIQDKIKFFNGDFIKNNIYKNENIPGKLKIPEIFLPHNNNDDKHKKDE